MIVDTGGGPAQLRTQCAGPLSGAWLVVARACVLAGFLLDNASGDTAASISLYSGADTGGQLLADLTVQAGSTLTYHGGALGLVADSGLFVKVTAGTLTVSVTTLERTGT